MIAPGRSSDTAGDKVVILISVFERGGAERQAYLLARELRQRYALNVEVWALKFSGDYVKEFEAIGVPTKVLGFVAPGYVADGVKLLHVPPRVLAFQDPLFPLRWARRLRRVAQQIKAGRVDILLPFTTWPNVIAGLTYRFAGVRQCIWGERSAGIERVAGLERISASQYRQFAANSTAGVEFLAEEMRVPRGRIAFIPNGVEEPKIDSRAADWRARLGLRPGQPLVVKIANISSSKDHATLLRAWKILQDAWPCRDRPFLALAGHLNDRYDECRRIAREAELDSTVRFLGSIADVPALIHASDMAVFSSPKEGMPNAVLECMVAGKAVVASDLPGVRDVLGPNASGSVVRPGDSDQFARRLLDLLRDKERRDALGEANKARIRSEFSVERMTERYLQVIKANGPTVLPNRSGEAKLMRDRECV